MILQYIEYILKNLLNNKLSGLTVQKTSLKIHVTSFKRSTKCQSNLSARFDQE